LRGKHASIPQSLSNENKESLKTNPTKSIFFQFFSEIERTKKKKKLKLPQSKSSSVTYLLQGLQISSVNIVIIIIIIIIKQQNRKQKRI